MPNLDLRTTFTRLFQQRTHDANTAISVKPSTTNGVGAPTVTSNSPANDDGARNASVRLRQGLGDVAGLGAGGTVGNKTLHRLQGDLNKNLIDDSPLTVTHGEILDAHATLMASSS